MLDVGYVADNVDPPWKGEKQLPFLETLALAWMVIGETRKKGLYDGAKFSFCDLILFFKHQLKVKIRSERKCLGHITFDKRWVHAARLVVRKGATLSHLSLPLLFIAVVDRVLRDPILGKSTMFPLPLFPSIFFPCFICSQSDICQRLWFSYISVLFYRSGPFPSPDILFFHNLIAPPQRRGRLAFFRVPENSWCPSF